MKRFKDLGFLVFGLGLFLGEARATDRFFSDCVGESLSKRYKVIAKSPDNEEGKEARAFQASFVYTCFDQTTKKVLWTRLQPMSEPSLPYEGATKKMSFPEEGSPVGIDVSDRGMTVIWTDFDELIFVDPSGKDRGQIDLLKEGLTKKENKEFVQWTTAGPMWASYSLTYFLSVGEQEFFVIRPWWGRRIIASSEKGTLVDETPEISNEALAYETKFVLTELSKGVHAQGDLEDYHEGIWTVLKASYLAGCLGITEATSFLEKLQGVTYCGSSTSGGLSADERIEGDVDPHSYRTLTLRQVAQLSLRRLGKVPASLPVNEFKVQDEDSDRDRPYQRAASEVPRASNVEKVKVGMKAKLVLDLIGEPDFVGYDTWEYDMDTKESFSLILKWDSWNVIGVEKKPALWKEGFSRDWDIIQ